MTEQENSIIWDSYYYPGTEILKNKLNIRTKEELKKAESTIAAERMLELRDNPIDMNFDKDHLREIHKYIFGDLYPFAGEYRKANMFKSDRTFLTIKSDKDIENNLDELFKKINERLSTCRNKMEFCEILADLYTNIIHIHPFREGNTRSSREFIREFSIKKSEEFNLGNLSIDFEKIDRKELDRYVRVAHLFPGVTASFFMDALEENVKGKKM